MPELTVVIADDHSIVRRGLRAVLDDHPHVRVVGEAATGREAIQICEQLRPRVVILDIGMPQLNGIDAGDQIRKACRGTQIIVLSMHVDESYVLRALTIGAKAYILKDSAEMDLIPAIEAVAQGRTFFSERIRLLLLEDYVRSLRQRGLDDSYHLLTDREKQVLQLIAEGRSNKEAATLLDIGVTTVETHRGNVMQKLGLHSTAEIVLYAVRKRLVS
jgi:DNA-binding NarL/FixJ family response regulator